MNQSKQIYKPGNAQTVNGAGQPGPDEGEEKALPFPLEHLPPAARDMAEAIAALNLLGDEDLWRAAKQNLAPEKAAEIEGLHAKRQSEGLSASESETLTMLMQEYTRIMLVRSRSAALLIQRGHDVSGLVEGHEP